MNKEQFVTKVNKVNKLNNLTVIAIIALYCVIAGLVIMLIVGKVEYVKIPDYKEAFGGNANPQIVILNNNTVSVDTDEDGKKVRNYSNTVYAYGAIDGLGENEYASFNYTVDFLTNQNKMVYLTYSQTSSTYQSIPAAIKRLVFYKDSRTASYNSESSSTLNEEGIKTAFINLDYYNGSSNVTVFQNKIDMITISEQEMKNALDMNISGAKATYTGSSNLQNVNFEVSNSSSSYYTYIFSINVKDLSSVYRIDAQSFIECKDGKVFPLGGVYNYSDDDANFTTNTRTGCNINKNLNVKNVYIKFKYYTSLNEVSTTTIKVNYGILCDNYTD